MTPPAARLRRSAWSCCRSTPAETILEGWVPLAASDERSAGCFTDHRAAAPVVHEVAGLVGQRVFGLALSYEDLIDHDQLRHDPILAVLGGKLAAQARRLCAAGRQVDAQSAGTEPGGADPLPQDQL